MRKVAAALLAVVLVAIAPVANADSRCGSKSCQHSCPIAQRAANEGFRVVSDLTLAIVDPGELEL